MGDDRHLTLDLLRAISRGERSSGDLTVLALAHLFGLCPACRNAFESWRRELGEGVASPSLEEYDAPFERARARLAEGPATCGPGEGPAEEAEARKRVRELLALPRDVRAERIRRTPGRYAGPALADLLLDEARSHVPGRPAEARAVAALAQAVLQHENATPYATELYARSLAHQANALRAQGELRLSDPLFQAGRYLLKPQAGGDPLVLTELDHMEGVLRRDQRRFDEAEILVSRAIAGYRMLGRSREQGQALLSLGVIFETRGDLERAIGSLREAEECFSPGIDDRSLWSVRHNLAYYRYRAGQPERAREVFEASRELYERFPDAFTQLRRLWLEGHLSRAEGDPEGAESAYRAARDGFLREGIGFDAALAALDLATLYAEEGRTGELKRLAEEIVPVFEAQDVHREAAAALMLFQDAVRAEQVTLRHILELIRYLELARRDPAFAFRRPA